MLRYFWTGFKILTRMRFIVQWQNSSGWKLHGLDEGQVLESILFRIFQKEIYNERTKFQKQNKTKENNNNNKNLPVKFGVKTV